MSETTIGPCLFPRVIGEYDELGYPLLNHDCPSCGAVALIINEWDAVECLSPGCGFREFGPDGPRASFRDWESEFKAAHPGTTAATATEKR